ncbi:DgyrCDS2332 [Dimorphilus gyrociliatus]|uniref:Receptor expression-enhancing protein n=1 Tax=Dimorphilus gyrociliatus TaxID=2664684 RepID=A0A7I8VD11_9ANNE|nr:DgyrCDS2332 [Dimorphilus gyrociliatus]
MISALVSRFVILVFGTLYPAYASYKAIKTRNTKEYLKWMMYWVIFALFTCAETVADLFVCWLPFYYELKIVFIIWLLSPATQGSKIIYKKIVHRQLAKHEEEIDTYIEQASDKGYSALLEIGSRGLSYATNVVLTTAMKGQTAVADHLRRSYSLNDVGSNQLFEGPSPTDSEIVIERKQKKERTKKQSAKASSDLSSVDEEDDDDSKISSSKRQV